MQNLHSTMQFYSRIEKDLDTFRQQHFFQWYLDAEGCAYCMTPTHWRFFGFVPRKNGQVLLVGVTQAQEFLYLKISVNDLLNHFGLQILYQGLASEWWSTTLLDYTVLAPQSIIDLPWKPMPEGLDLWDDSGAFVMITQLARPFFWHRTDPERALSLAFAQVLDREILQFLSTECRYPQFSTYQFLASAHNPALRQERMALLRKNLVMVRRRLAPKEEEL